MRVFWQIGGVLVVSILIGLFLVTRSASPLVKYETRATSSAASAAIAAGSPTSTIPSETYRVMKVVDGDTLVIDMNGVGTTLRLIGLDTPETVDPRKPVQCFGKAASDKAKELLTGKRVSIEKDMSQGEVDKYGRLLAYIYLPDGRLFNRYMIAEGYGHEYTYRLPYKYQKEFKAAEARARSEKKGLWADSACATQSARTVSAASPSMTNVPSGSPASAKASSGNYDCSHNVYNCPSFKTQAEAQKVFDACGLPGQGGDSNDVHKLDSDKDGRVCESLP